MKKIKPLLSIALAMLLIAIPCVNGFAAPPTNPPQVILEAQFIDESLFRGAEYTVDVYLNNLESYAVALPFLFNTNLIEIKDIQTFNFTDLEGVVKNSGQFSGNGQAQKFDGGTISDLDYDVINDEGKFLLSLRKADTASDLSNPITISTATKYFSITFKVNEDAEVPTPADGWLFKEYNKISGIEADTLFADNGVFGSIKDDLGAYYLKSDTRYPEPFMHDLEYSPLTYVYMINVTDIDNLDDPDVPDPDIDTPDIPLIPDDPDEPVVIEIEDTTLKIVSIDPELPSDVSGKYITTYGEYPNEEITSAFGGGMNQDIIDDGVVWTVYKNGSTTDSAAAVLSDNDILNPVFTPDTAGEYVIRVSSKTNAALYDEITIVVKSSVAVTGRALLTGKHRADIGLSGTNDVYNYEARKSGIDEGIKVQLFEAATGKKIGNPVYTNNTDVTEAAFSGDTFTAYNYTLYVPADIAADFSADGKYMLRFTRIGDKDEVGDPLSVREESYLSAELLLNGAGAGIDIFTDSISIKKPTYLYAGAFYVPSENKTSIGLSDLADIKAQVGNENNNTIWNINEYLGVDSADYSTVLRYVGKQKSDTGFITLNDVNQATVVN